MAQRKKRVMAAAQPGEIVQKRRRRREIIAELKRITKKGGGIIKAEDVVDAAQDTANPLHGEFEWDNDIAAEGFRLIQARRLLRLHWLELKLGDSVVSLPLYMSSHPTTGDAGYVESISLDGPVILSLALRDLAAWEKRYGVLLSMHGIILPEDLPALIGIKRKETA